MEMTNPLVGCSEKWLLVSVWWIPGPGCCAFRLSSTLSLQIMWYSEWSKKKVSPLGSIPHGWRSCVLTHSLSFRGGIVGHRLSGNWALPLWGRDDPGKVKLFLLPFTMHLFLDFLFLIVVCWNFSEGLPQRHCHPWAIAKISVPWRMMIEN